MKRHDRFDPVSLEAPDPLAVMFDLLLVKLFPLRLDPRPLNRNDMRSVRLAPSAGYLLHTDCNDRPSSDGSTYAVCSICSIAQQSLFVLFPLYLMQQPLPL